ncbi:hypothetical protein ACOMHN_061752 [Nucella lapillus]
MRRPAHCQDRVLSGAHRYQVLNSRSLLECLTLCQPDGHCRSLVFDADRFLCYLGNAKSAENCSNMEPAVGNLQFYESTNTGGETVTDEITPSSADDSTDSSTKAETSTIPCQNGGQLDGNGSCVCVNSYVGTHCENRMQDCTEGRASGFFTTNGVYHIQPALSPNPFPVNCQMLTNNTRTVILYRKDRASTFNRTWQEFRDGFGDLSSDFWLGLDKIYQLTQSKTYQLRIRIKPNGTTVYKFYSSFTLNDQAGGYTFTIGSALTDSTQDCMSDLQGAKFSTYDADNDGNADTNCAAVFGGGWWYTGANCSACNLLGPVPADDGQSQGVLEGAFWPGFDFYPFPLVMYLVVPE